MKTKRRALSECLALALPYMTEENEYVCTAVWKAYKDDLMTHRESGATIDYVRSLLVIPIDGTDLVLKPYTLAVWLSKTQQSFRDAMQTLNLGSDKDRKLYLREMTRFRRAWMKHMIRTLKAEGR